MDYLNKEHINFIEPHMWPANSPDINPVDYAIRVLFQHSATSLPPTTIQDGGITETSNSHRVEKKLSQRFIDNIINEWRRRLEAGIKNGGGHIEHCNLDSAAAHHFITIER